MIPRSWWIGALFGLLIVATLPLIGHYSRKDADVRCSWDGLPLKPVYQVTIIEASGRTNSFCCIRCAEDWMEQHHQTPANIFLTDETSGEQIKETDAVYVRSTVATNDVTGNRIHVFRLVEDAKKHAAAAHGRVLEISEFPFADTGLTFPGNN